MTTIAASIIFLVASPQLTRADEDAQSKEALEKETNREVTRTYVVYHLSDRDLAEAKRVLVDHLKKDPEDSASWNLLALTLQKQGKHKNAARYYLKAIETAPDDKRSIYYYNYADAANRYGDSKKARNALIRATEDPRIANSARNAMDTLEANKPLPPMKMELLDKWGMSLGANIGYDSNVILVADKSVTSTAASDRESLVLTPNLSITHYKPFKSGSAISSDFSSAFTWNLNEKVKTYNSLYGALGFEYLAAPKGYPSWDFLGFHIGAETSLVNVDSLKFYNWTPTITYKVTWNYSALTKLLIELPIHYQGYLREGDTSAVNKRTGYGATPTVTYTTHWDPADVSIGAEFEKHYAKGDNYKATRWKLPVSMVFPSWFGSKWNWSFAMDYTYYSKADPVRRDRNFEAATGWSWSIGVPLQMSMSYTFTRNLSNSKLARYTKHNGALLVTYALF